MIVTVRCATCQERQVMARWIDRPCRFPARCHTCERLLMIDVSADDLLTLATKAAMANLSTAT